MWKGMDRCGRGLLLIYKFKFASLFAHVVGITFSDCSVDDYPPEHPPTSFLGIFGLAAASMNFLNPKCQTPLSAYEYNKKFIETLSGFWQTLPTNVASREL